MSQFHLQQLHNSLVQSAKRFHLAEADLLEHIQKADKTQLYAHRGFNSMFMYVTKEIGLSDSTAYNFINVARKSIEVPELKAAIESGDIGVSKARKISPVLTKDNHKQWITKAKEMSSRVLENEVIESNPELKPKGYTKRLSKELVRVAFDLSPEDAELLFKAKDLLSSNKSKSINNEDAFKIAFGELVEKYDPVKKANRAKTKKQKKTQSTPQQSTKKQQKQELNNGSDKTTSLVTGQAKIPKGNHNKRPLIKAETKHQLMQKEQGQCNYISPNGQKCGCKRHLHIHHIQPVSQGGGNELENLTLLCSKHHRLVHEKNGY